MAFCTNCGHNISGDSKFCPDCGSAVTDTLPSITVASGSAPVSETAAGTSVLSGPVKPKVSPKILTLIGGIGAVVILIAIGTSASTSATKFQAAVDSCLSEGQDGYDDIQVSDNGSAMYLDGSGEEDYSSLDYVDQFCVLNALDIPEIIVTRMNATSSLMGVQTGDWDGITASWTYHPNNGLDISLTKK